MFISKFTEVLYYGKDNLVKATEQFNKAVKFNQNRIWAKLMLNLKL